MGLLNALEDFIEIAFYQLSSVLDVLLWLASFCHLFAHDKFVTATDHMGQLNFEMTIFVM